jgi:hypothetical protein
MTTLIPHGWQPYKQSRQVSVFGVPEIARVVQRANPADAHAQAISGGARQAEHRTCAEVARSIRAAGASTNDASRSAHKEARQVATTGPATGAVEQTSRALIIAALTLFASGICEVLA